VQQYEGLGMKVTVVAGNPKPGSRTLEAVGLVAEAVAGAAPDAIIDVIELGPGLLGWGDDGVASAVAAVAESDLVVFGSPTFKATYTGVLKLFLDQFATGDGLRDVVAVPVMLGAGPAHALAPDLLLKPVLVELGAATPAPGLYLLDSTYRTDDRIADYAQRWAPVLQAATSVRAGRA
jgi:FMN reductase